MLNPSFKTVFVIDDADTFPTDFLNLDVDISAFEITIERVNKLLNDIDVSKSGGPNGLSATLLKFCVLCHGFLTEFISTR